MREIEKIQCPFDRVIQDVGDRDKLIVHVYLSDGSIHDKNLYVNKCMQITKISDDYNLSRMIVLFYKVYNEKF